MATILVTDGNERSALAVVRSLGRAGHAVHVCAASRRSLAGASRHAVARHRVPDPLADPGGFASAVARVAREQEVDITLPISDPSILALLERRGRLGDIRVPFPDLRSYQGVSDKKLLLEEAATLGIAVPAQHLLESKDDLTPQLLDELRFPLVMKPSRSVSGAGPDTGPDADPDDGRGDPERGSPGRGDAAPATEPRKAGWSSPSDGEGGSVAAPAPPRASASGASAPAGPFGATGPSGGSLSRTKLKVRHFSEPEPLRRHLVELPESGFPILLQERIVGPGIGVFLLLRDGECVARFSHRRLREKPPSGGVSVYREAVSPDPDLVDASRLLLQRFDWEGVAMVEYKRDAITGTPYLMEVNARFWGSLQLAIDAGVDFPSLLVECELGEAPTPVREYRVGTRSRWFWGDVDHLLARLLKSKEALALPPGAPGRGRAVADFLHLARAGDRNEVLRISDPAPFLRETIDWFRGRR